jgi:glycosyltransferase involved in cell wall biosynthesis
MGEPRPDQPGAIGIEELAAYQAAGVVEWWSQPADAAPTFRQADIFCLPGAYAAEIPTPLIEALATGLPVVAGDFPSLRPVIRHGVNGLLVAPRDAQALAGALERILGDTEFRQSAAARSREIAEAEFSLDNFLTASLIVYRATLGIVPATRARLEPQRSSDCASD